MLKVGDGEAIKGDPLKVVEDELKDVKYVSVPGLPSFTGMICTLDGVKHSIARVNDSFTLNYERWRCWIHWI